MRAYFDKLLSSSQQQKPLPLIYPVLIALFAGGLSVHSGCIPRFMSMEIPAHFSVL